MALFTRRQHMFLPDAESWHGRSETGIVHVLRSLFDLIFILLERQTSGEGCGTAGCRMFICTLEWGWIG